MPKIKWKSQEEIDREREEAERLASLPGELEQLQAQINASVAYTEFLEEALVEMAQQIY